MKEKMKKLMTFVMMVGVFTLLAGMSVSAKTHKEDRGVPINWTNEYYIYSGPASGISKVKSSNKKVGTVITKKNGSDVNVFLRLKKTGTTTLSYKVRNKGKTDTYRIKLHAYKYKNPFKTLKIGETSYKSQFNECEYSTLMQGKGKVQVKVKKGWEVKAIKVCSNANNKWKKLKKGATVDIENEHSLLIVLKNKKYGFTKDFWIWGAVG